MPLRSSRPAPHNDSAVERRPDPKNVFDREPLLMPQRLVERRQPWYRRRQWWLPSIVALGALSRLVRFRR